MHLDNIRSIDYCFFAPVDSIEDFLPRLICICDYHINFLEQIQETDAALHLAYFEKFKTIFNQLEAMHQKYAFIENLPLLILVFRWLVKSEKIDFLGEPLEGIQFMGLLETRLLDFDNLVITNLNEGILPSGKKNHSFLPFDLKKNSTCPLFWKTTPSILITFTASFKGPKGFIYFITPKVMDSTLEK